VDGWERELKVRVKAINKTLAGGRAWHVRNVSRDLPRLTSVFSRAFRPGSFRTLLPERSDGEPFWDFSAAGRRGFAVQEVRRDCEAALACGEESG
jgi:hypothetical protein